MDVDRELDGWRHEWRTEAAAPPDLAARVARETRRMRQLVVGEIVVTMLMGGGSIAWAAISRRRELLVLAVGIWVFLALAWGISWWLRRGAWAPLSTATSAFLDLSVLRCRRRRRAIFAQAGLYVAILSFDLWWLHANGHPQPGMPVWSFLTHRGVAWVWPLTAVLGLVAAHQYRRLGRELQTLTDLQQAFQYDNGGAKEMSVWHLRTPNGRRATSRKRTGWRHGGG